MKNNILNKYFKFDILYAIQYHKEYNKLFLNNFHKCYILFFINLKIYKF